MLQRSPRWTGWSLGALSMLRCFALVHMDRKLVKYQSASIQNGTYVCTNQFTVRAPEAAIGQTASGMHLLMFMLCSATPPPLIPKETQLNEIEAAHWPPIIKI